MILKISLTNAAGATKEYTFGYKIAVDASAAIREERKVEFQKKNDLLLKTLPVTAHEEVLKQSLTDFFPTQIPTEGDVRDWFYQGDELNARGIVFSIQSACSCTEVEAATIFDNLTDDQYADVRFAVNKLFYGAQFANAMKLRREHADAEAKRQRDLGYANYEELVMAAIAARNLVGQEKVVAAIRDIKE